MHSSDGALPQLPGIWQPPLPHAAQHRQPILAVAPYKARCATNFPFFSALPIDVCFAIVPIVLSPSLQIAACQLN